MNGSQFLNPAHLFCFYQLFICLDVLLLGYHWRPLMHDVVIVQNQVWNMICIRISVPPKRYILNAIENTIYP
jgi:hypothetical protein